MYNRQDDFTIEEVEVDKSDYFDLPKTEIYGVFNDQIGLWIYEVFNNNEWNLKSLNGQGTVIAVNDEGFTDEEQFIWYLTGLFPGADIQVYENYENWLYDHVNGVRK